MIRLVTQVALVVGLAIAFVVQTAALWTLWEAPVAKPVEGQRLETAPTKQLAKVPDPLQHRPIEQFQQTMSRPLFVEGRRPPQPKPAAVPPTIAKQLAPAAPPLDRYRLLGIHLDAQVRRALIQSPSGIRTWVAQGERIDEWQVVSVEADRAHLAIQDRREELRLYPSRPGG